MRKGLIIAGMALIGLYAIAAIGWAGHLGRSDPAAAGYFRPPLFNFSADYDTGAALGFRIGSSRSEVLQSIAARRLQIDPACWGDNRAGGASLYTSADLLAKARVQPSLCLHQPRQLTVLHFDQDRLTRVSVSYVRTDIIT